MCRPKCRIIDRQDRKTLKVTQKPLLENLQEKNKTRKVYLNRVEDTESQKETCVLRAGAGQEKKTQKQPPEKVAIQSEH